MTKIKVGDIVCWNSFYHAFTKDGVVTKRCTKWGEEVSNGRYFCVLLFDTGTISGPVKIKEINLLTG
jgi:hypothetical protein